jgi:RND superfamily putative drug exporter
VASAGVILAGTFGSLLLAGVAFLTQMGAAVTVGIVLAAFVISVFLVPAVTALIGTRAWWPGRVERRTPEPEQVDAEAPAEPAEDRSRT